MTENTPYRRTDGMATMTPGPMIKIVVFDDESKKSEPVCLMPGDSLQLTDRHGVTRMITYGLSESERKALLNADGPA